MDATLSLMQDLEHSISLGSAGGHEATLRQVTDLLVAEVGRLTDEQVAILDGVIGRLARAVERREARAELARRLAPLDRAPPGVVRSLAHDHIAVARPVLLASPCLGDSDLVAVAVARGPGHRQAIAQRSDLSEKVVQVLVAQGDRRVLHALAGNRGAQLSQESAAALVDHARPDDELRDLLAARQDLPDGQVRRLVDLSPAAARRAVGGSGESCAPRGQALPKVIGRARHVTGSRDFRDALDTVCAITLMRPVDEEDVAGFAEQGQLEEVICAVASALGLNLATVERLFTVEHSDLILLLGKAKGWSWATLQALLRLREPHAVPDDSRRLAARFGNLEPRTAERFLRFVARRERSAG